MKINRQRIHWAHFRRFGTNNLRQSFFAGRMIAEPGLFGGFGHVKPAFDAQILPCSKLLFQSCPSCFGL